MSRPHVLVLHTRTSRPHAPDFQAKLDVLNDNAVGVVESLGYAAELVAAAEVAADDLAAAVDRADAVVVMGGEDFHPSFYGGLDAYPEQGHHDLDGDLAQLAAVRQCVEERIPLLGICRGHQLINVALGGTLVAHLPTADGHRSFGDDPFVPHRVDVRHPGLATDLGADGEVRCSHHQAIDRVADGLEVVAYAADGVVEAVVGTNLPITGVQWHPENPVDAATQLGPLVRRAVAQAEVVRGPARSQA